MEDRKDLSVILAEMEMVAAKCLVSDKRGYTRIKKSREKQVISLLLDLRDDCLGSTAILLEKSYEDLCKIRSLINIP